MEHVDAAAAAEYGFQQHLAGVVAGHFADNGRVVPVRQAAEQGNGLFGNLGGDKGEQLPFIGEVERIDAQQARRRL